MKKYLLSILTLLVVALSATAEVYTSGETMRMTQSGKDIHLFAKTARPYIKVSLGEVQEVVWTFRGVESEKADTFRVETVKKDSVFVEREGVYGVSYSGKSEEQWWMSPEVGDVSYKADSVTCEGVFLSANVGRRFFVVGSDTITEKYTYNWVYGDTLESESRQPEMDLTGVYDKGQLKLTVTNMAGNVAVVVDSVSPVAVKAVFEMENKKENAVNESVVTGGVISSPADVELKNNSKGGFTVSEWAIGTEARLYERDPIYQFQKPGTYRLSLTVTNEEAGCQSTDSSLVVTVSEAELGFPNAFTPNGDGANDLFLPAFRSLRTYNLTIFNRWGRRVFETSDPKEGWDGKINGREASAGTYYFYATAEAFESGVVLRRHGSVTLLR